MKKCNKCGEEKAFAEFSKKSASKSGYSVWCKKCHNQYKVNHYNNHPDEYVKKRKKRRTDMLTWMYEIKQNLKCNRCPEGHIATLDFHHKDPNEKEYHISEMRDFSKKRILAEMEKCEILCSNCHRKEHYCEKYGPIV